MPSAMLGKLVQVDIREIWPNEAADFTPWLLEHADYLAEALNIDLELEAAEHSVGPFKLDLIGKDNTNDAVLMIENQLEQTDHNHLGQVLTYAAGTGASTVVWIAKEFREEHRQALDWLNQETGDETHFFGIELKAVRIGDSDPAPMLDVLAQPNDWEKQVKASTDAHRHTGKSAMYIEFWQLFLGRVLAEHAAWTQRKQAVINPDNWIDLPAPLSGAHFSNSFAQKGRIRSELYIDSGNSDENDALFQSLLSKQQDLEDAYGRALIFEELPGKRACRVADYAEGDVTETEKHDSFVAWFVDSGERFRKGLAAVASD